MAMILFILEDNEDVVEQLGHIATKQGYELKSARCVDDGVAVAREIAGLDPRPRVLAILDLMLPVTRADLDALVPLLDERQKVILHFMSENGGGSSDEVAAKARGDVAGIDERIRGLIDREGGVRFLEKAAQYMTGWEEIVYSALGWDKAKAAVEEALRGTVETWWQKPVRPGEIVRLLQEKMDGR